MRDVTRRKTWELDIRRARDAAEAANRAKDEFLANMSHEIRTPLNGVLGVAGALALSPLAPDQRLMLQTIEDSGRELERMLTGVLELVRVESSTEEVRCEPVEPARMLEELRQAYARSAAAKGLTLRVEAGVEATLLGDPVRLRGVLTRLLDNAIKFTEAGSVVLGLELTPVGSTVRARFSVRDTGVGFAPEQADRLFDRFHQQDGSSTRRFGGSGLGLAVCRSLAASMGGTVEAASEQTGGACFTLSLDLQPASETYSEAPEAPRVRVLLAEDHPVNRQVVELILRDAGVDLTCVENGREAVDAAATGRFDLVLMDVQMPVMDGLSAIRAIRTREASRGEPRTPIYTLTANALSHQAHEALNAGADEHLTKPISAARLIAAVGRAAPEIKATRAA
jgi:CheY-like chemotaxis protein